jgi:hypothetical protein
LDLRTYYAPEVEQALVGLIWQEPKLLERLLRELDPAIHFVQPHLRHILEAIRIGYAQLGAVDWCVVVQILREQKLLEQVGELQTLDELWRNPGYSALFDYYINLLKSYAEQRGTNPHEPVFRFTGGRVQLERNRAWHRQGDPEYIGAARVAGLDYRVRGWERSNHRIDVKLYPRR